MVATEFHEVHGLDLSRPSPGCPPTTSSPRRWRGIGLGEVVDAPGVEDDSLLEAVFEADLAAFGAQSTELANRYRSDAAADQ